MTTPVIIDVIAAAVLIAGAVWGARRGLFRALAGLAVVIAALVGAAVIGPRPGGACGGVGHPADPGRHRSRVEEAMAQQSPEVQMPEEDGGRRIRDPGPAGSDGAGRGCAGRIWPARPRRRSGTPASPWPWPWRRAWRSPFSTRHCFLLSFVGLTVLLKLLIRALDLVTRLPGLHGAQRPGRCGHRAHRGGACPVPGRLGPAALRRLL